MRTYAPIDVEALIECLRECSQDLDAYITCQYVGTLHYPSQQRKHARDMEPVVKARKLLRRLGHG